MKQILTLLLFMTLAPLTHAKEIVLTEDNTVVLNQSFTPQSVGKLMGEIKKLDAELKNGYPIYLFLYTPGGSIDAGLELIEFVKGINRPIHTITMFSASMGFQVVQHMGTRYITEYGVLMSHKAYGGFEGEFGGESSQLDSQYSLWLRLLKRMDTKTVSRTNGKKTLKQYQAEYDNELWLTGEEAVKNGYADEVVSVKCSPSLAGERTEEISVMGFRLKVVFDKCPMRTAPIKVSVNIRTNKGMMDLDNFIEKGGILDSETCQGPVAAQYDWSGRVIAPGQEASLCALDKGISMEKINQAVSEYKNKNLTKSKQIVKMNFKNFVSE